MAKIAPKQEIVVDIDSMQRVIKGKMRILNYKANTCDYIRALSPKVRCLDNPDIAVTRISYLDMSALLESGHPRQSPVHALSACQALLVTNMANPWVG